MLKVKEKGAKLTNQMKFWLFRHWGLSVRTKVEVWKAVVGSVLRYGSEVWWLGQNPTRDLEVVQLDACKTIMRISGSTTTAFVRGELGLPELERERHVAMLLWYGRLCEMDGKRWAKKLFEIEWEGERRRGGRTKAWKDVVCDVVKKYNLEKSMQKKWLGLLTQAQWGEVVRRRVAVVSKEKWEEEMRMGKKLDIYRELKCKWGYEVYLEGRYGRGEVLKAKFRSGSIVLGQETALWMRGVEEGKEQFCRRGLCKACSSGVVETVRHVLVECVGYKGLRDEWGERVRDVVLRSGSKGWAEADPLKLMLGWQDPRMVFWEIVAVARISSAFFVSLWEERCAFHYGPRVLCASGVKDYINYGTKS